MIMDVAKAAQIVVSLPFFWNAMAGSTIMAMFFGAMIYDGNIEESRKGSWALLSYMFMIFLSMGSYIVYRYPTVSPGLTYQLFFYPIQILFLSFFWFIGFLLGIKIHRYVIRRRV